MRIWWNFLQGIPLHFHPGISQFCWHFTDGLLTNPRLSRHCYQVRRPTSDVLWSQREIFRQTRISSDEGEADSRITFWSQWTDGKNLWSQVSTWIQNGKRNCDGQHSKTLFQSIWSTSVASKPRPHQLTKDDFQTFGQGYQKILKHIYYQSHLTQWHPIEVYLFGKNLIRWRMNEHCDPTPKWGAGKEGTCYSSRHSPYWNTWQSLVDFSNSKHLQWHTAHIWYTEETFRHSPHLWRGKSLDDSLCCFWGIVTCFVPCLNTLLQPWKDACTYCTHIWQAPPVCLLTNWRHRSLNLNILSEECLCKVRLDRFLRHFWTTLGVWVLFTPDEKERIPNRKTLQCNERPGAIDILSSQHWKHLSYTLKIFGFPFVRSQVRANTPILSTVFNTCFLNAFSLTVLGVCTLLRVEYHAAIWIHSVRLTCVYYVTLWSKLHGRGSTNVKEHTPHWAILCLNWRTVFFFGTRQCLFYGTRQFPQIWRIYQGKTHFEEAPQRKVRRIRSDCKFSCVNLSQQKCNRIALEVKWFGSARTTFCSLSLLTSHKFNTFFNLCLPDSIHSFFLRTNGKLTQLCLLHWEAFCIALSWVPLPK